MDWKKIEILLDKYYKAETSLEEEHELSEAFQEKVIPNDLASYKMEFEYFQKSASRKLEGDINLELSNSTIVAENVYRKKNWPWIDVQKIAAAFLFLLTGFSTGILFNNNFKGQNNQNIQQELIEIKSMMVLTLLKNSSPIDRLKAINLSSDLDIEEDNLLDNILKTFRNDPNENVRIAALNELYHYLGNHQVREALGKELFSQQSEIVLSVLIDVLLSIEDQAIQSVLKKYTDRPGGSEFIKNKISTQL